MPVESRKQPGFALLVIADFFLPDEVAELALEYSQAFADLLRESGPLLKFIRVGYENYALGLVDWTRRRSDGVLVWEG